jgi:hypothetical protein
MNLRFLPFSSMKETWDFREEPENLRVLGVYLWRTLLAFALLALLCAGWLGIQELNTVTQAENVAQPHSAPPAPLDPNKLQAQLTTFSARQQAYQTLSSSSLPQVADPSK